MEELPKMLVEKKDMVSTFFPAFIKVLADQKLEKSFLGLSETELERAVGHKCPDDLYEHRHKFWLEYYASQASGLEMVAESIVPTHMPLHVYIEYLLREHRIYFLIIPPKEYAARASAVLYKSLENFMAIQSKSPINEDGSVDFKLANLQKDIHVLIDFRLHGSPTQKTHSIVETNEKKTVNIKQDDPDKIIDAKLMELEHKLNKAKALDAKLPEALSLSAAPQINQPEVKYPNPERDYEKILRKMNGEKKTTKI